MLWSLGDNNVVSFFKCALNVRLLFRMTQRRRGVTLTQIFWLPMKRVSCQVLSLDFSKPYRMLCWKLSVRSVALVVVKSHLLLLVLSSNLIFAAPSLTKSGLESAEQIFDFDNLVKTISKNVFQKFDSTRWKTAGVKRCNFSRRFPSFQQWNYYGNPSDTWAVCKGKEWVEYGQYFLEGKRTEWLEKWRWNVVSASCSFAFHLFDGR